MSIKKNYLYVFKEITFLKFYLVVSDLLMGEVVSELTNNNFRAQHRQDQDQGLSRAHHRQDQDQGLSRAPTRRDPEPAGVTRSQTRREVDPGVSRARQRAEGDQGPGGPRRPPYRGEIDPSRAGNFTSDPLQCDEDSFRGSGDPRGVSSPPARGFYRGGEPDSGLESGHSNTCKY